MWGNWGRKGRLKMETQNRVQSKAIAPSSGAGEVHGATSKWKMTEHSFGAASLGRSWTSCPRGTEMDVVGPGTLWEGAGSAAGTRPLTTGGRAGTVRPASRSRARGPHLPYLRLSTAAEGQTQHPQFQAAAAATSSSCANAAAAAAWTFRRVAIASSSVLPNGNLPEQPPAAHAPRGIVSPALPGC